MSNVTDERLQDLVCLVNNRLREFGPDTFPLLSWGVVRLMLAAVHEWEDCNPAPMVELSSPGVGDTDMMDGYHIGYQRGLEAGRAEMRREVNRPDEMKGLVGSPSIRIYGDAQLVAAAHTNGNGHHADAEQIRADADELGEQWPTLEDEPDDYPSDEDVAAEIAEHHAAVEALVGKETIDAFMADAPPKSDEKLTSLPPATVATLGPEHTTVTPMVPRRNPVPEVDAGALSGARMSKDERAADLRATIYALQDMAEDGMMPSMNEWLLNRPAGMVTAQGVMGRHNMTWAQLAEYAKLKLKGTRGKGIGR